MRFGRLAQVFIWHLKMALRQRFFWIWNSLVGFIVLAMNFITPFDFEGSGVLINEYFISSCKLAVFVNSIAFQLRLTLRQKLRGEWEMMLAGPVRPAELLLGMLAAYLLIQELLLVCLGVLHFTMMRVVEKPMGPEIYAAFFTLTLTLISLSVFHLATAVFFKETWALIWMVCGYLAAQISEQLYSLAPQVLHWAIDVIYCIVPDLEPWGSSRAGEGWPPESTFVYTTLYITLYSAMVLWLTATLLPGALAGRKS